MGSTPPAGREADMPLELRRAETGDHFSQVAQLHAEGITEGFLSTLGSGFLAQLYRGIAGARDSGVFISVEGDEVLGFISYARDVKSCYQEVLRRRWPHLALAMVPNLFRASIYRKVFETLRYPGSGGSHGPERPEQAPDGIRPELLSMAVSARSRGKGVGKILVAALDEEFQLQDLPGYFVVTHAVDERSNGFYLGRGFQLVGEFESHGKPMNEYFKVFKDDRRTG
jgi:ribosomal protein S18 acetylase RimI-like enzyme